MGRAKYHAEVAAIVFFLLGIATVGIALMGSVRPLFVGLVHRSTVLLAAAAFFSAAIGIALRHEFSWYWSLAVAGGFVSGGLLQLAAREPIGAGTIIVGLALIVSVVRASPWFPHGTVRVGSDFESPRAHGLEFGPGPQTVTRP